MKNKLIFAGCMAAVVAAAAWFFWPASDDDGPRNGADSETTSEVVSASPTAPGPPEYPSTGRNNTEEGAKAAVKFEIDATNYTGDTLDPSPLEAVYDLDRCRECEGLIQVATEKVGDNDEYLTGGLYRIVAFPRFQWGAGRDGARVAMIEVTVAQDKVEKHAKDGAVISSREASETTYLYQLAFQDGKWEIIAVGELS